MSPRPLDSALEDTLAAAGLDPVEFDGASTTDIALAAAEEALGALHMAQKRFLLTLAAARNLMDAKGKAAARRFLQLALERAFDEMRPPEHRV